MKPPREVRVLGTRVAGEGGDGELYGVTTVASRNEGGRGYMRRPCSSCPWRVDQPTGRFPAQAFRESARTACDMADSTFACHTSGRDDPKTCAGFLLRNARHNLAVRLAIYAGRLDPEDVEDGGLELFPSYRAMAEANGVPADDPALADCRADSD